MLRSGQRRGPASWVPPWGVGTVLQEAVRKPSSSSGQEIAHSTRPCSSGNFASPTKGSGVSVLRFSSVEARKSESPLGKWMLSFSGVWSPFSRRLLSSEEHTSELQSLMRISYAVFCLKKRKRIYPEQAYTAITR